MAQFAIFFALGVLHTVCFLIITNRGNRLRMTQDKTVKPRQKDKKESHITKPATGEVDLYV